MAWTEEKGKYDQLATRLVDTCLGCTISTQKRCRKTAELLGKDVSQVCSILCAHHYFTGGVR